MTARTTLEMIVELAHRQRERVMAGLGVRHQ